MALINTIREKSGWAVGTVAIGMLLFIVGGDLVGGKNRLFGRNENVVGEVAGQKVELADYNNSLEQAKQQYTAQQQRPPDEQALGYLRDQAWNQTIYRLAFQPEWSKLGLGVSDDELVDMVQGDKINAAASVAHQRSLNDVFLPQLARRLEDQLRTAQKRQSRIRLRGAQKLCDAA